MKAPKNTPRILTMLGWIFLLIALPIFLYHLQQIDKLRIFDPLVRTPSFNAPISLSNPFPYLIPNFNLLFLIPNLLSLIILSLAAMRAYSKTIRAWAVIGVLLLLGISYLETIIYKSWRTSYKQCVIERWVCR